MIAAGAVTPEDMSRIQADEALAAAAKAKLEAELIEAPALETSTL